MTLNEVKYTLKHTFAYASAAVTRNYLPIPFDADLTAVYVVTGSVASIATGYTVRVGSAGTVAVATVTGTANLKGVVESLTTTRTSFTTANSVGVSRGITGTLGVVTLGLVFEKG